MANILAFPQEKIANTPDLYIVSHRPEGSSAKQYREVVEHLVEAFQRDGRLKTKEIKVNPEKYDEAIDNLRHGRAHQKIETDRPFAFLFINPAKTQADDTQAEQILQAMTTAIDHDTTRNKKKAAATAFMFLNNGNGTKGKIEYKNHNPIIRELNLDHGDIFEMIKSKFFSFTHVDIAREPELKSEDFDDYARALAQDVLTQVKK